MIDPLRLHRLAHACWRWRIPWVPGLLHRLTFLLTHCDLPPAVRVGRGVIFKHWGSGVVVHHRAVIGDGAVIHPQAVIGQRTGPRGDCALTSLEIGPGAVLGAGCRILAAGVFRIGAGAGVGAGAVVLASVPDGATAVGVPARVRTGEARC
jgi:serine O-acetyltransferase